MIHHHIDSGIALATGILSLMGGVVGHSLAQSAPTPDWVGLISGPVGAIVLGGLSLRYLITQGKKQEARTAALEAKHDEFLERTLTLAARSDEHIVSSTAMMDKVHGALSETNRLLTEVRANQDDSQ